MITKERIAELYKISRRNLADLDANEWFSLLDAAIDAHDFRDWMEAARRERDGAIAGLECAIRAAWDGPEHMVGTNCEESYSQWRARMEKTAREALARVK